MKKSVLSCIAFSAVAIVGNSAFAEEKKETKVALDSSDTSGSSLFSQEQIDFLKKEVLKKDVSENIIKVGGVVQANANFHDSQSARTPNFNASKVRLGLNISGGIATGQIEVQFNGNQAPGTVEDGTVKNAEVSDNGRGQVTIRRGQLNLDVLTVKSNENTYTTTLSLGGIRIGGADGVGPDAAMTTSGFARQDGAYLKQAMTFGKSAKFELGIGAFNNIFAAHNAAYAEDKDENSAFSWGASVSTLQANWTEGSFSKSLGIAGHAAASYDIDDNQSFSAKFLIGSQGNAPSKQNKDGLSQARDVTHIEASALYNHKAMFGSKGVLSGNGIGFWYENENIGKTKTATKSGDDFSYAASKDNSQNASLYGVGIAADSSNFLTDLLQKGDFITYAANYSLADVTFGSKDTSKDYNVSQAAVSVGYGVNTFETALNFSYSASEAKVFQNSEGKTNQTSATKAYVTAIYAF